MRYIVHGLNVGRNADVWEVFDDYDRAEAYYLHLLNQTCDYAVELSEAVEDECGDCAAVRDLNLPNFHCPYCDDTGLRWMPRA